MTFKLNWDLPPTTFSPLSSTTVNYCHLCIKRRVCDSVPGIKLPCYSYRRHWFREQLDIIFHDCLWYRRWTGGAWISYFVDGVAGVLHEPACGATPIRIHMHAVRWEYFPPAVKPILDKFTEVDR